ncbi:MAG: alpha/beta fold hydrolase, partial [Hyphomicrobiales bacterium]
MKKSEVHGARLFYRQAGAGTPVVMLHSCASTGAQWHGITEQLTSKHRVVTPDLPGHGGSTALPLTGPNSLGAEAAVVLDLIERLDEPVHLVGHSYGAAIAV